MRDRGSYNYFRTLRKEALAAARNRQHTMRLVEYYAGIMADGVRLRRSATWGCKYCHRQVTVNTKPLPNEIEIGGEAVALNCEWFDSCGVLQRPIPMEAVEECAAPGPADESVRLWVKKLGFSYDGVNRESAVKHLKGTRVWTEEEMKEWDERQINETLFWLICGSLNDGETTYVVE